MRWLCSLCFVLLGCYSSRDDDGSLDGALRIDGALVPSLHDGAVDPSARDGSIRDGSVRDVRDGSTDPSARDAAPDAERPIILDEWVPITAERARCLGLDDPACASCHVVPGTDQWVLNPTYAPPEPNTGARDFTPPSGCP